MAGGNEEGGLANSDCPKASNNTKSQSFYLEIIARKQAARVLTSPLNPRGGAALSIQPIKCINYQLGFS